MKSGRTGKDGEANAGAEERTGVLSRQRVVVTQPLFLTGKTGVSCSSTDQLTNVPKGLFVNRASSLRLSKRTHTTRFSHNDWYKNRGKVNPCLGIFGRDPPRSPPRLLILPPRHPESSISHTNCRPFSLEHRTSTEHPTNLGLALTRSAPAQMEDQIH